MAFPELDTVEKTQKGWTKMDNYKTLNCKCTGAPCYLTKLRDSCRRNFVHLRVAMYRWLIQCCAAADMAKHEGKHPDAMPKYECVLVLGGDEGLHKTSFIKYLLPAELHKYIKDSVRLDTKDRDSMLNILRCWIPELADLDPALKKKWLPELKGFLAKEVDEIRLTYARKPTVIRRHVSCMTSVDGEYPPKGTRWDRRFLPIIAKGRLDYPRVSNFDYTDLWAFIWHAYTHGGGGNGGLCPKKRLYVRKY
ncbi:putative DNA primase/helicase [Bathymodiolus platifrons methanotrophic gill symbiont]|nr:putative DNA primase/helicase [Bathymodiolus platifrons methanotrophic gill symbiont]